MLLRKIRKKILYVNLKKALYECLWSALIFYWKLWDKFKEYGFAINTYNLCVAKHR